MPIFKVHVLLQSSNFFFSIFTGAKMQIDVRDKRMATEAVNRLIKLFADLENTCHNKMFSERKLLKNIYASISLRSAFRRQFSFLSSAALLKKLLLDKKQLARG